MSFLYDVKLKDGEIINDCYFIKYILPVFGGKNDFLITYADRDIKMFTKDGKEIKGKGVSEIEILKIYDEYTLEDVTEPFLKRVQTMGCYSFDWFIRETIRM